MSLRFGRGGVIYQGMCMLTEHEVSRAWSRLFKEGAPDEDKVAKAEQLLENLRPESPLRHRLDSELEEIRKIGGAIRRQQGVSAEFGGLKL